MKNKKGQLGLWVFGAIFLVALLVIVGVGINVLNKAGEREAENLEVTGNCGGSDPVLSLAYNDELQQGTSITTSTKARVKTNRGYNDKGFITSTTKFSVGDEYELLVNASNFVDKVIKGTITRCGSNDLPSGENLLMPTSAPVFRVVPAQIEGTGSLLTETTTGTTANETESTSAISPRLRVSPGALKGTGDMFIVIDINDSVRVSDIKSTDLSAHNSEWAGCKPQSYTSTGASNTLRCFSTSNIIGQTDYVFSLEPRSGNEINGSYVNITGYGAQGFVDDDGTYRIGIEDASGDAKYEWVESTWFYIGGQPE